MSKMLEHFDLGLNPPLEVTHDFYFVYCGYAILSRTADAKWSPLLEPEWQTLGVVAQSKHYIGAWHRIACYAIELELETTAPAGYEWISLRHFIRSPDDALFALAGRGVQIIEWHRTHRYCGQCGGELATHSVDRARECNSCKRTFYPRLSPCIIVLVTRGEEVLLARGDRHPEGMYSTLAGFIEPGETAEHAVHREVREEVGIEISNLEYWGSQPWPFPHQLMLGFYAEYKQGELIFEDEEITEASWWHYRELPQHPPETTISGKLIHDYLDRIRRK